MNRLRFAIGVVALSALAAAPAAAVDLDFDFNVNQGPTGTTFATLSLDELVPGTTTFTLDTVLSGAQGNPGIVELFFGCNGCGSPTFIPASPGITFEPGGTQAGYTFDFRVAFDPAATAGNTPLTWTAMGSPDVFLESTPGAGPNAFALIQLTGGMEVIDGQNIESGFYVAVVPEPSAYVMLVAGLGVMGLALRAKSRRARRMELRYEL